MRRRLLNLLTALSLVVCLGAAALWARSYFRADVFSLAGGPPPPGVSTEWFVRSEFGVLYCARNESWGVGWWYAPRPLTWGTHRADPGGRGPVAQRRRPCFVAGPFSLGGSDWAAGTHVGFTVPHWIAAALAAVAPVLWAVRRLRARRRDTPGRCRRCGYDLRATPGQCPECGTIAAPIPAV